MAYIQEHWSVIVTALLALSEVLGLIPPVKANSVFQLVTGLLKKAIPAPAQPAKIEEKK